MILLSISELNSTRTIDHSFLIIQMSERFVSTIQLCEEVGMSRSTLDNPKGWRLIAWTRVLQGPWQKGADVLEQTVIQALRSRSALAES